MDHCTQIGYRPVKSRLMGDLTMSPRFGAAGQGPAYSLAFVRLRDHALIARGGSDGIIRFIDIPTGQTLHEIERAHRGAVRALTPLPDGEDGRKRLASCGVDCVVRVWDLDTFARASEVRLANPKQDHAQIASVGIGGRALIAVTVGAGVHLWDPDAGDEPIQLGQPTDQIWSLATTMVHGEVRIAGGGNDGRIHLWDPVTGELVRWFPAHQSTVWALAGHNGGSFPLLASGAADSRIRVWDPATGSLQRELTGHSSTIRTLTVVGSPDGERLASGSADSTIRLWDPRTGALAAEPFEGYRGEVWALAPVEIGGRWQIAAGGAEGSLLLLDPQTRHGETVLAGSAGTVWALSAVTVDDKVLVASGGVEGSIRVTEVSTDTDVRTLSGHRSTVRALASVPAAGASPPLIASGGADGSVRLWDARLGGEVKELRRDHVGEVWSLAAFSEGEARYVVSGGADRRIRVWEADGARREPRLIGEHNGSITEIAVVTGDGTPLIATGSTSGMVRFWHPDGTVPLPSYDTGGVSVTALATYPHDGGSRLACGLGSGRVFLLDPLTGRPTGELAQSPSTVHALVGCQTDNGVVIMGGCEDGKIRAWSPVTRSLTHRIRSAHTSAVRALAPAEVDGRPVVVSASDDGSMRRWDLAVPGAYGEKEPLRARPATKVDPDRPSSVDALERQVFVDALHDFLTSPMTDPPVVIGVHGPLGHGKSSVLTQLRDRLDPPSPGQGGTLSHKIRWYDDTDRPLTPSWALRRLNAHARNPSHDLPGRLEAAGAGAGGAVAHNLTVWFSPWMYHSREELWAGLSQEIIKAVTGGLSQEDQVRLWFELNLRRSDPVPIRLRLLSAVLPRTAVGWATALLAVAAAIVAVGSEGFVIYHRPVLAGVVAGLSVLFVVGRVVWSAMRGSVLGVLHPRMFQGPLGGLGTGPGGSAPPAEASTDPLHESRAGYLYLLQHDIGRIVEVATAERPITVFVDDLDRCSSELIGQTMEAINLFVNGGAFRHCNFVLAVDPAMIAAHIEADRERVIARIAGDPVSYGGMDNLGWSFMEKMIHLPVRIPELSQEAVSDYADSLLTLLPAPSPPAAQAAPQQEAVPGDPAQTAPLPDAAPASPEAAGQQAETGPEESADVISLIESFPEVAQALRESIKRLPRRSPRHIKRFVNLWRFYITLEFRAGQLSGDIDDVVTRARQVARFVEVVLGWPQYLDRLSRATDGRSPIRELAEAAGEQERWPPVARRLGLDPAGEQVEALRVLLVVVEVDALTDLCDRYL
jgi:WD40 repeat protein